MGKISKTLTLKKAWFNDDSVRSFESVISAIDEKFKDKKDRKYQSELQRFYEIADIKKCEDEEGGYFVRIHGSNDGSILLTNKLSQVADEKLEDHSAPDNKSFLHDEIILYAVENDIICCDVGNKESIVKNLIESVFERAENNNAKINFKLSNVPNSDSIERINKVGVKHIDFGIEGYLRSIKGINDSGLLKKIFGVALNGDGLKKEAGATGRIILKKTKIKGQSFDKNEWLTEIGSDVADEFSDYTIKLDDNSVISSSSLKVSKSVKFQNLSGGIPYLSAQLELRNYYRELKRSAVVG